MNYRFKLIVPLTYRDVVIDSEEVELTEQEVSLIKKLVGKSRNKRYGLMPILKERMEVPRFWAIEPDKFLKEDGIIMPYAAIIQLSGKDRWEDL
mgnify:CR=1 FL=1